MRFTARSTGAERPHKRLIVYDITIRTTFSRFLLQAAESSRRNACRPSSKHRMRFSLHFPRPQPAECELSEPPPGGCGSPAHIVRGAPQTASRRLKGETKRLQGFIGRIRRTHTKPASSLRNLAGCTPSPSLGEWFRVRSASANAAKGREHTACPSKANPLAGSARGFALSAGTSTRPFGTRQAPEAPPQPITTPAVRRAFPTLRPPRGRPPCPPRRSGRAPVRGSPYRRAATPCRPAERHRAAWR